MPVASCKATFAVTIASHACTTTPLLIYLQRKRNFWHCIAVRIMQRQSVQASWRSALSQHVIVFEHGPTLLEMVKQHCSGPMIFTLV